MNRDNRPDPDALLANLAPRSRGHLKIFLGSAPGVGKTWEMLAAARHRREAGVDVVVGLVETHGREETARQIGELEVLPRRKVPYRGQILEEFDLDAALARHPALLLVDELAHTNAPGLRHTKRWLDVRELLEAGIDVWTTLNVQHLESLNDQVARITGVRVSETIPDTVLDLADEIELIDLSPAELRARLNEGRVYRADVAKRALGGFFREGNLAALREMALRHVAQRVDKDVTTYMRAQAIPGPWPASERVLALVGHDASADNVVRQAARLAAALHAPLIVFHAEGPNDDASVQHALDLAVQLGGTVATTTTSDVVSAALNYAAEQNVTHIVIGRGPSRPWWWRFGPRSIAERLRREAPAFTLHFVPVPAAPPQRPRRPAPATFIWQPYAVVVIALAGVSAAGVMLRAFIPREAMGLVFNALIVAAASQYGRALALATAIGGFLCWNFLFLPPVGTFSVADPRDVVALGVFLITGLITGSLAGRVRVEAQAASSRIEALRRISLFGQRFSRAATPMDLLREAAAEAAAMTTAGMAVLAEIDVLGPPVTEPAGTQLDEAALAAADWAFHNNIETGIGTATLPSVAWRFVPLRANGRPVGVVGARPEAPPPEPLIQTLAALADQAAMALERVRLTIAAAQAGAREDSQKLRTALLSSLSHDLRTPLTAIRGAAETLARSGDSLDAATQADLLASITQNTERMTKFLGSVTELARIETGEIRPRRERVALAETIEAAIARVPAATYAGVNIAPDASQVIADPALLEQCLVNILDNAAKYSPEGSRITVTARRAGGRIAIAVADEGVGISPSDLPLVFDSFFRATRGDRVASGTGLGLAIAKAFTEAMDGTIRAMSPRPDLPADGAPGTVITLELPAG
jgi:two-component system sensor histidine kinase KdpD